MKTRDLSILLPACTGLALAQPAYLIPVTSGDIVTRTERSWGCGLADYDGDGLVDIYIATELSTANRLYHNHGGFQFSRVTDETDLEVASDSGVGIWADWDNDGDLDLFVSNYDPTPDFFFLNDPGDPNRPRRFRRLTDGPWVSDTGLGQGAAWGDYDRDGHVDLFVANTADQSEFLYRNDGRGEMIPVIDDPVVLSAGRSQSGTWGDYDGDGDLDLFVANNGEADRLYHNQARANGNNNSWLLVRLIGTQSNRSAIGAKVRARTILWGQDVWQLREISGGGGHCSQNDLRAHLGLGDATKVDVLRIEWPSGIVQELKDVDPNQILTVTEPPRLIPQAAGAFQIQCGINQSFEIQASTDLTEWTTLGTVTHSETGTLPFVDAQADQHQSRYYRVMAQ